MGCKAIGGCMSDYNIGLGLGMLIMGFYGFVDWGMVPEMVTGSGVCVVGHLYTQNKKSRSGHPVDMEKPE